MCGRRFPDDRAPTVCPDDGSPLIAMGQPGGRTSGSRRPVSAPLPPSPAPQRPRHTGPVVLRPLGSASMIGATVANRYVIEEKIGSGGMGVVYRARQLLVDRAVALKILPRDLADDAAAAKRFTNEAKAISQLRHPNIVTLYDFGLVEDGRPFIAMEFVDGRTLTELIKAGPLDISLAVGIVRQVACALQAAHDMGIIHRDIKADNVMIERRLIGADQVRVLDFGIARQQGADQRLTQTGIVYATPQYCSPEQALAQPLDARSDLYSLGVLFFEMLSGRLPFTDKLGPLLLHKHINEAAPRLSAVVPELGLPPAVDRLVDALLAKDPDRRPGSARALIERLDALSSDAEPADPPALDPIEGDPEDVPLAVSAEVDTEALLGERDATPPVAPRAPSHRLALYLALGLGSLAAVGAVSLFVEPASEDGDGDAVRQPAALRRTEPPALPSLAPPSAPESTVAPPPPLAPIDPRLRAGLTGELVAPHIPESHLSASADAPIPPPPGCDPLAPGTALEARRAQAEAALAATPPGHPDRPRRLLELAGVRWLAANAAHAVAWTRHVAAEDAYLAGRSETLPVAPSPQYDEAVEPLEAWLSTAATAAPERPWVLYYAGQALVSAGRREEGMARFRQLVAAHPESPHAAAARRPMADHLLFDDRKPAEAAGLYAAVATTAGPQERLYARFMLAHARFNEGNFAAAADAFRAVLAEPMSQNALWRKIEGAALDGLTLTFARLPNGEERARDFFGGRGDAPTRLRLLARLLAAAGETPRALALYATLVAEVATAGPGALEALVAEVGAAPGVRADAPEKGALAFYEAVLAQTDRLPAAATLTAATGKAAVLRRGGDWAGAIATLDAALARAETSAGPDPGLAVARTAARIDRIALDGAALAELPVETAARSEHQASGLARDLQARLGVVLRRLDALGADADLPGNGAAARALARGDAHASAATALDRLGAQSPADLDGRAQAAHRARLEADALRLREAAARHAETALALGRGHPDGAAIVARAEAALDALRARRTAGRGVDQP
jgi:serine/threonine protein kinase